MSRLVALSDDELRLMRRALLAYNDSDRPDWEAVRKQLVNDILLELAARRDR